MKELIVGMEYENIRVDRYVAKACKEISKMTIQKMIRTGRVKVNGKKTKPDARLAAGDTITIFAAEKTPSVIKKNLPKPEIIYEDAFVIAANKPAGLIVHPNGIKEDTLTGRITSYLHDDLQQYNQMFIPGVINRLDINTSGIVLAPKTPASSKVLHELMRKNKIIKKYLVLVKGIFPKKIKAVHYALKDTQTNKMVLYDSEIQNGIKMTGIFEPIEIKNGCTLISARLITGRTHQIRAQLNKLGYPVAGDIKYGDKEFNAELSKKYGLNRQFLHCCFISFPLRNGQGKIKITCGLPADLQNVLNGLKMKTEFLN